MRKIDTSGVRDAIASEFMLADIRISMWSGRFGDHRAAVEIEADDVKRLFFPNGIGKPFKDLNKMLGAARSEHYALTLPWSVFGPEDNTKRTGARLLSSDLLFKHAKVIAKAEVDMSRMLTAIEPGYADMVKTAAATCNEGKFAEDFYPTFEQVKDKYGLHRDYSPVPVPSDFSRMGALPGAVVEKMMARMESAQDVALTNAVADVWTRASDAVSHVATQLADKEDGSKHRLFDTTRDKVLDVMEELRAYKLTVDPDVDSIAREATSMFEHTEIKEVRKDDGLRLSIAETAQGLAQKMAELAV